MLDEAKKREKIANAVLGATFALSAAQSPKDFVKTGHIESPGTALMQRWGRVRGEAERNLDSGRVVGRNRKIKETYDDEMFRQHSKERPLTSDERTSHSSKTSSLLKKMRELNLSSPKKKKKKKLNEDFNVLDERTLMSRTPTKKSGTMPIPGSEGAARKDVARAGFRRSGPIQEPKVEKSGTDVPIWVRTHKSPGDYAAHTAKQKHQEGEKVDTKELKRQFHQTGANKKSEVHDITVGSPKSKVKDPGQRARQFVSALKNVKDIVKAKKGIATNTPTAISSSGKKRKRSDEEGAEQRGRIYSKMGMSERNPKTGVQMAKIGEGRTFNEFLYLIEMRKEDKVAGKKKTPLYLSRTHKTVQSAPGDSGKKWERKDIKVKRPNPEAVMGRVRQGKSSTPGESSYADSGYARGPGFGYKPQPHGTGGESRGVKRTATIQQRRERPKWEPGVDTRTPAQKVEDRRKKAAYKGYKYK